MVVSSMVSSWCLYSVFMVRLSVITQWRFLRGVPAVPPWGLLHGCSVGTDVVPEHGCLSQLERESILFGAACIAI